MQPLTLPSYTKGERRGPSHAEQPLLQSENESPKWYVNCRTIKMAACFHENLECINQFEFVRKYRCADCGGVMMCSCDEIIGRKFLAHQLSEGSELRTRRRVSVTHGFQPKTCRECRHLSPEPHPVAPIHGRTSKIRRFYWREIAFRKFELFGAWAEANGLDPNRASGPEVVAAHKRAGAAALDEIKLMHAKAPKYDMREESSAEVIRRHNIQLVELHAALVKASGGADRIQVITKNGPVSVEDFTHTHYQNQGFQVLRVESRPFHVLFGIFMWLVIQDASDPLLQMSGFGSRTAFDKKEPGVEIWTLLPQDFGTPGYYQRREASIDAHIAGLDSHDTLVWLFDYWLEHSEHLRQYLWAHREADILAARQIIDIVQASTIREILRFLVKDYWHRFTGWPDLLVHREDGYFFAEVKASGDKLSEDQKNWIRLNAAELRLPFRIVKVIPL